MSTNFKIPQLTAELNFKTLAYEIAKEIAINEPVISFNFVVSTGDLIEDENSFIDFANGIRFRITDDLINNTVNRFFSEFLNFGWVLNDMVVKDWRIHEPVGTDSESKLLFHFEKIPESITENSSEILVSALEDYFSKLSFDFDRADLNHLPGPSVWPQIVCKLLDEQGYPHLIDTIDYIAIEVSKYIAIMICCEIIENIDNIRTSDILDDILQAKPDKEWKKRVWAENLLNLISDKK